MKKNPQSAQDVDLLVEKINQLQTEIEKLSLAVAGAQERERRAVADYQNLVRRSAEERLRMAKLAGQDLVETLLEPLSHLSLAAEQLNNPGLNLVVTQLWQRLNEAGLEEIDPLHQEFNVQTMEAVPDQVQAGETETKLDQKSELGKVSKVVAKGYKLNGEVIRHAKVIVV